MTIQPLPHTTRCFAGESVDSFCRRLASQNGLGWQDIEQAAFERGLLDARAFDAPDRKTLWRLLGALNERAFTIGDVVHDSWVTERPLCLRCCQGRRAFGRAPLVGKVCLAHRRWLGTRQRQIDGDQPALRAEVRFRRHLAPRGVHYDSPAMEIGRDCARVIMADSNVQEKHGRADSDDIDLRGYSHQVAITVVITRPEFIATISSPDVTRVDKQRCISEALDDAHIRTESAWRVRNRMWDVSNHLTFVVRSTNGRQGSTTHEDRYGLLRLSRPYA